jgi:protein disulfide isomerase
MESSKSIQDFVNSNILPLFGNLDGETYGKYMGAGKGMVWVLLNIESTADLPDAVSAVRNDFVELAKKFPNYSFFYLDTVVFKAAVENMLGVTEFPAIAVHKVAGDKKKYIHTGDLNAKEVAKFLKDVEAGKIEATLKSEDVPESNDEPVRVVVGSTLKDEVFQADKDVLFEVYAPWCGHCKKLAPEYEKLAQKVRKEGLEDILSIAKMDGTTNDSPVDSISWEGFPTLFYVKAGSSEPVPFEAGRDAKSIWKWIKKNHSKSDEIAKRIAASKASESDEASEETKDEL